jgi:hypothetical protein
MAALSALSENKKKVERILVLHFNLAHLELSERKEEKKKKNLKNANPSTQSKLCRAQSNGTRLLFSICRQDEAKECLFKAMKMFMIICRRRGEENRFLHTQLALSLFFTLSFSNCKKQ